MKLEELMGGDEFLWNDRNYTIMDRQCPGGGIVKITFYSEELKNESGSRAICLDNDDVSLVDSKEIIEVDLEDSLEGI